VFVLLEQGVELTPHVSVGPALIVEKSGPGLALKIAGDVISGLDFLPAVRAHFP
jgi:hypothetical protein